jgi:hypothetical protein
MHQLVPLQCAEDGVSPLSPAQVALFRIYACIAEGAEGADGAGPAPFRLLVPSQQIGCLLGKGGAIIKVRGCTS